MSEEKEPIITKRTKEILEKLALGRTRNDISEDYNYSTYKSLDIYMRRKNYRWDSSHETYIPALNRMDNILEEVSSNIPVKAEKIIRQFDEYGDDSDPKKIAETMGFDDHNELAKYMQDNGLIWDLAKGNYIEDYRSTNAKSNDDIVDDTDGGTDTENIEKFDSISIKNSLDDIEEGTVEELLSYLPLLKVLAEHKDKLLDLLLVSSEGQIPVYGVPGNPATKSVYMSTLLSRLLSDFGETKNISQKNIVEASIIEYLIKYGYKLEVEKLLAKR